MKENSSSALYSGYIIDGTRMDETPAQMLEECMSPGTAGDDSAEGHPADTIIDESSDPEPGCVRHDGASVMEYLDLILSKTGKVRSVNPAFPDFSTRLRLAGSIIDSLWAEGHFRLENLRIDAAWEWDSAPVGNMAAFYFSVQSASEYIYDLGTSLASYSFRDRPGLCRVTFSASSVSGQSETSGYSEESAGFTSDDNGEIPEDPDDMFSEGLPDGFAGRPDDSSAADKGTSTGEISGKHKGSWISHERKCPDKALPDQKSWLIYIPFDTCSHRLGGSLLEEVTGSSSDTCPEIRDPDYFIDCFEVVRELVEDGVIIAGATVSDGGLLTAAARLCRKTGACIDVSGIVASYMEKDIVKILFAEIPGILVQISGNEYDYTDSQLLLQDVAYYPIGHPGKGDGKISVVHSSRSDVAGILASLIGGIDSSEGED